jgi:DNA-3-methyladenine glycosylase
MSVDGMIDENRQRRVAVPRRGPNPAPAPVARKSLPLQAPELAHWLIGKRLIRVVGDEIMAGRIVETEAYLSNDPASHSFGGLTARNRSMFGPRGFAYVYRIYGMWWCFNVSAGAAGEGAAVLVRALAPLDGMETMRRRRGQAMVRDLARGPGRLCQALGIDRTLDGTDLCRRGPLWLAPGAQHQPDVGQSVRIGISRAAEAPLRFFERNTPFVSGPRRLNG